MNCEKLTNAGMDVSAFVNRLMGNEALVPMFVKKFTEDGAYARWQAAMGQTDPQEIEGAAHALKGMCGNLSLTLLYEKFTEQVNLVRTGDTAGALAMAGGIATLYDATLTAMRAWLSEQ